MALGGRRLFPSRQVLAGFFSTAEIHINDIARPAAFHIYQDRVVGITLARGRHRLMVKVFEGFGAHNFRVGFLDDSGKPIPGGPPGIEVVLMPGG